MAHGSIAPGGPSLTVAASNSPVDAAWAAYDAAAIRLHVMHQRAAGEPDTTAGLADRRRLAIEVARLWKEFEALFNADDGEPRPAA